MKGLTMSIVIFICGVIAGSLISVLAFKFLHIHRHKWGEWEFITCRRVEKIDDWGGKESYAECVYRRQCETCGKEKFKRVKS